MDIAADHYRGRKAQNVGLLDEDICELTTEIGDLAFGEELTFK